MNRSVSSQVEVAVDPQTAFAAFTGEMDLWWVRGPVNFFDAARATAKVCEPGVGGRILEVYGDDDALEVARITDWEPGARLALAVYYPKPATAARWLAGAFGLTPTTPIPDSDDARGWIEFHVGNCSLLVFGLDDGDGATGVATHVPWLFVDDLDAHFDHRPGAARHALSGPARRPQREPEPREKGWRRTDASGRYVAERNNHAKGVARGDLLVHHYLTFLVEPVLTGPDERSGACVVIDDVISQGREPEPGLRPSLSRRWRVAAGTLAVVVAGLAVIGVGLRHGTASPGIPAATAGGETGAGGGAQSIPFVPAPAPQNHPALVICAPSTGVCSMRGSRDMVEVRISVNTARAGGMRAGA